MRRAKAASGPAMKMMAAQAVLRVSRRGDFVVSGNPRSDNRSPRCSVGDQLVAGGATAASGWLLRLSASATKPDAFMSSTKPRT